MFEFSITNTDDGLEDTGLFVLSLSNNLSYQLKSFSD